MVLLAALPLAVSPSRVDASSAPSYAMIGDSITWQAQDHLRNAVPGMRVDGVIGRPFAHSEEALAEMLKGGTPDILIVALGTNPTMTLSQVDSFMSKTGAIGRVAFVNIRIPRTWESSTNELIGSLPDRYPKVSVIDWYGYTAIHPHLLNDTGYHLTDEAKPIYAEFIANAVRELAGLCPPGEPSDGTCGPSGTFFDDDRSQFEADIEWIAARGITRGCNPPSNSRFCPGDFVTRGQMAALLVRALGYTDSGIGDWFVDDDGSTFEADIDRLATAGVTRGCNPPVNDEFCPTSRVTRGQMAAFLRRAIDP
ncbi:MAG: hypothetical protein U9R51_08990 [Actinomycetota bacterium]|nr:hypothetical protein [Actinomycetota bacterium]